MLHIHEKTFKYNILSIHTKHGSGVHRDRPRRVTHPNSLHTNAYDKAITMPTEESVRRAMAIQLIINREWGLAKNEKLQVQISIEDGSRKAGNEFLFVVRVPNPVPFARRQIRTNRPQN
jgi:Methylmalonyl-CoA mutase